MRKDDFSPSEYAGVEKLLAALLDGVPDGVPVYGFGGVDYDKARLLDSLSSGDDGAWSYVDDLLALSRDRLARRSRAAFRADEPKGRATVAALERGAYTPMQRRMAEQVLETSRALRLLRGGTGLDVTPNDVASVMAFFVQAGPFAAAFLDLEPINIAAEIHGMAQETVAVLPAATTERYREGRALSLRERNAFPDGGEELWHALHLVKESGLDGLAAGVVLEELDGRLVVRSAVGT